MTVMSDDIRSTKVCSTISSGGGIWFKPLADRYAEDSTTFLTMTIVTILSTLPAIGFMLVSCFVRRPSEFFGKWFRTCMIISALIFVICAAVTMVIGLSAYNKSVDKINEDSRTVAETYKICIASADSTGMISISSLPASVASFIHPLASIPNGISVADFQKIRRVFDQIYDNSKTYHDVRIALGCVAAAITLIGLLIAVCMSKSVQGILKTSKDGSFPDGKQPYSGYVPYPAPIPYGAPIYPYAGPMYSAPPAGNFYHGNGQSYPAPVNGQSYSAPVNDHAVKDQSIVAIGQPCQPDGKPYQV